MVFFVKKLPKTRRLLEPMKTVRRILPILWRSARGWSIAATVLMALEVAFGLGVLFLIKQLVDVVTTVLASDNAASNLGSVQLFVGLTGAATLGFLICRGLAGYAREAQGMRVADYVDRMIHGRALAADLAFYESPLYFDTLQRARQSGNQRPAQVVGNLLMMVKNLVMLAAVIVLLATISLALLPILIVAIVPALFVRLHFTRVLYEWRRERTQMERRAGYLDWLMTSDIQAKEIRLNQIGSWLRDLYSSMRTQLRGEQLDITRRRTINESVVGIVTTAVFFGALAFLAWQTALGRNSVGDLVLFLLIFQRAQTMGQELIGQISRFFEDHLYINQLFEFLEVTPRVGSPDNPRKIPEQISDGFLMDRVNFTYPGCQEQVLHDIDLRIRPGEIVALVGANGCGKTTLIKLMCRLYDPTGGRISVDGIDAREFDLDEYRRFFSVIFQDFSKYLDTVRNNIRFGDIHLPINSSKVAGAARRAGAEEFIKSLPSGYDTLLGRAFDKGVELSIGQWQKTALARAFIRPSKIIILDEPTSALDPNAEYELFENFRERIENRAALVISHRLSTIRMADYIYVMEHGRIVERGTHEELMEVAGVYHQAFVRQGKYYTTQSPISTN